MIQFLKLSTGEEVIAEVSRVGSAYCLHEPVRVGLTNQGVAMMPFSPFLKGKEITIGAEHVLFAADPDDELKNAYNSKFGSGIVLPPPGLTI